MTPKLQSIGKIVKVSVGTGQYNVYWGFPEWLDEVNNIRKQYIYNNDTLEGIVAIDL
jgi:hypothetical protein